MSRGENIKTERRRRNGAALQGNRQRLALNMDQLDRENFEYRWVNDTGTRLYDLTVNDDWDVVHDRDGKARVDSAGIGSEISTTVDVDKAGKPVRGVLLRKAKRFYEEDQAQKMRAIDDQEALLRQKPSAQGNDGNVYVKDGTRLTQEYKP